MIELTEQQRHALVALRWLHSEAAEDRRQGRSTVLCLHALWLAAQRPGKWFQVLTHWPGEHRGDSELVETVEALAASLGLSIEMRAIREGLDVRVTEPPSAASLAALAKLVEP